MVPYLCKKCTISIICAVKCNMMKLLIPQKQSFIRGSFTVLPAFSWQQRLKQSAVGSAVSRIAVQIFYGATHKNTHSTPTQQHLPFRQRIKHILYIQFRIKWEGGSHYEEGSALVCAEDQATWCVYRAPTLLHYIHINMHTVSLWRNAQVCIQILGKLSCWRASLFSDKKGNILIIHVFPVDNLL